MRPTHLPPLHQHRFSPFLFPVHWIPCFLTLSLSLFLSLSLLQTALKLLDCEFADENVRAFAVRMLETLPDEQLEDFLIQLTQVKWPVASCTFYVLTLR